MGRIEREQAKSILDAKSGNICRDEYMVIGDNYGGDIRPGYDAGDGVPYIGFPHNGFYDTSDKISIFPHHISVKYSNNTNFFGWRDRGFKFTSKEARKCHKQMWDIACILHAAGIKTRVVSVYGSGKGYVEWNVFDPTDDENENFSIRDSIGVECEDHDVALWVYTTRDDLVNLL